MPRRLRHALILLAVALVSAAAAAFIGCRPKEQLDPHFRPKYAKADLRSVAGDPCEGIVKAFVELGVFDAQSTYFDADGHIDRGTFITWLLRAWDIYYRDDPKMWIRLAKATPESTWTYSDVMPHTPLYPYLEGMIQAGILVGFEKGEWGYSELLTREQLVLLRNSVVLGRDAVFALEEERDDYRVSLRSFLTDADAVTEAYMPAVATDLGRGETIKLAFPDVDLDTRDPKPTLHPTQLVTNREALFALSKLGKRNYRNAQVKGLPEWKPLSEEAQKALDEADAAARESASGDQHQH